MTLFLLAAWHDEYTEGTYLDIPKYNNLFSLSIERVNKIH